MIDIKELSDILPIVYSNKVLNFLNVDDTEWYIQNAKSWYFKQYQDNRIDNRTSNKKLQAILYKLIEEYNLLIESGNEVRLVLKENNTIIGGCTLYKSSHYINSLELGYFIIPEYQHRGLAYEMLRHTIFKIKNSKMVFDHIILTIRKDNKASITLAEKLNFTIINVYKGKYKNNIVYKIDRESIS